MEKGNSVVIICIICISFIVGFVSHIIVDEEVVCDDCDDCDTTRMAKMLYSKGWMVFCPTF